jgi:hypothetical protein
VTVFYLLFLFFHQDVYSISKHVGNDRVGYQAPTFRVIFLFCIYWKVISNANLIWRISWCLLLNYNLVFLWIIQHFPHVSFIVFLNFCMYHPLPTLTDCWLLGNRDHALTLYMVCIIQLSVCSVLNQYYNFMSFTFHSTKLLVNRHATKWKLCYLLFKLEALFLTICGILFFWGEWYN